MANRIVSRAAFRLFAAAWLAVCGAAPALADGVSVASDGGYGRLLFTFTPMTQPKARVDGGVLTISFDRKVAIDPGGIANSLGAYIASVRTDGNTFRFALSQSVHLHTSTSANHVAIDLVPASFAGNPPDLPPPPPKAPPQIVDASTLPVLPVRSGAYQNFTRLVFDWPRNVRYTMYPGAGKLGIRFDALARPDLSTIARFTRRPG